MPNTLTIIFALAWLWAEWRAWRYQRAHIDSLTDLYIERLERAAVAAQGGPPSPYLAAENAFRRATQEDRHAE